MQEKVEKKAKRSDERSGSVRKNIRFEDDLIDAIDADRKDKPFSEWVKDACWKKLKKGPFQNVQ
jgi:hypothetical protein